MCGFGDDVLFLLNCLDLGEGKLDSAAPDLKCYFVSCNVPTCLKKVNAHIMGFNVIFNEWGNSGRGFLKMLISNGSIF